MQPIEEDTDPEFDALAEATDRLAASVKEPAIRARLGEIADVVRTLGRRNR